MSLLLQLLFGFAAFFCSAAFLGSCIASSLTTEPAPILGKNKQNVIRKAKLDKQRDEFKARRLANKKRGKRFKPTALDYSIASFFSSLCFYVTAIPLVHIGLPWLEVLMCSSLFLAWEVYIYLPVLKWMLVRLMWFFVRPTIIAFFGFLEYASNVCLHCHSTWLLVKFFLSFDGRVSRSNKSVVFQLLRRRQSLYFLGMLSLALTADSASASGIKRGAESNPTVKRHKSEASNRAIPNFSPISFPESSPGCSSTEPEANVENAANDLSGGDTFETALREILSELRLEKEGVEEVIKLFSCETKSTAFESIMKKHFVLLVKIRDDNMTHEQVKDELVELKKEFAKLIEHHGFIPNTGQMPSAFAKVIQVRHCIICLR